MSYLSSLLDKYEGIIVEEENIILRKKALRGNILRVVKEQGVNPDLKEEYKRIKDLKLIEESNKERSGELK